LCTILNKFTLLWHADKIVADKFSSNRKNPLILPQKNHEKDIISPSFHGTFGSGLRIRVKE
jgi:hypothetical protein